MRLSRQLEEAYKVPTPYEMYRKHNMPIPPEFITKGRKGMEAKGPRLFLSKSDGSWSLDAKVIGRGVTKKTFDDKKKASKLARKLLGQLRDYGDDFVVNDGKRSYRVQGGDILAFAKAQQAVKTFFKRG